MLAWGLAATQAALARRLEAASAASPREESQRLGIPGPFAGLVVAVHHGGSIRSGQYQRDPVRKMIERGMTALTGAPSPAEAWRFFFEPGDVVAIKVNPVGYPHVYSAPEVLHAVIDGLREAGVKPRDVLVCDRYRAAFQRAGMSRWLPPEVRWGGPSWIYQEVQLDMGGYSPDVYVELPLVNPACAERYRLDDPHVRRSYVARLLVTEANKLINLCVLKHHDSAGVTLALKNLSHGLVNNVNRSHVTPTANATGLFIPAVVDLPVFRRKVVLHILDGIKGAYHGGPRGSPPQPTIGPYVWEHKTMYFATDPVALDWVGWKQLDAKRAEVGLAPIAQSLPDAGQVSLRCQVEHIELAAHLGLGVAGEDKIRVQRFDLSD